MITAENRSKHDLTVIAGHCSFSPDHLGELHQIADLRIPDGRGGRYGPVRAVRLVGLKSRTSFNEEGNGMGIDFPVIEKILMGGCTDEIPPSVLVAEQFVRDTGLGVATEIMLPEVQLPLYEKRIPKGQLFPWNPSVMQLGWPMRRMGVIAARNEWTVLVKNGKWLGEPLHEVNLPEGKESSMEKAWVGLATYAAASGCKVAFVHRGVDIPEKGNNRNLLVHEVVRRLARSFPNADRYFDPSHSLGPNNRDRIVPTTVEAMRMRVGNEYLYTGILIEVGTSITDTKQHITVDEFHCMLGEIGKFRKFSRPKLSIGTIYERT